MVTGRLTEVHVFPTLWFHLEEKKPILIEKLTELFIMFAKTDIQIIRMHIRSKLKKKNNSEQ